MEREVTVITKKPDPGNPRISLVSCDHPQLFR